MQTNLMQAQTQPFIKLAQSNMELLTQFSTSPEITSQGVTVNPTQWLQQANESTMKLMQSGAFSSLIQGMLKNYTEFLTELAQGSVSMMSQARNTMTRQVEEATQRGDANAPMQQQPTYQSN